MNFCTFPGQKWTSLKDDPALREIEVWTGHRNPRNPMKILFFITLAAIVAFFTFGCATTTTRLPDGTEITRKGLDVSPETKAFFGDALRHQLRMPPRAIERSGK